MSVWCSPAPFSSTGTTVYMPYLWSDWAELPQLQTDPASHPKEQQFQRWYELFFSTRAPPLTRDVLQFLTGSILKRSLGSLIALLVERKRSPQELLNWIEQQSRSK